MPIKRLQENRPAQFPCIGKLRKGGPKRQGKNGKEIMGVDLNHFRFDTDDALAMQRFTEAYGEEPDTVTVFLPYVSTAENFSAWQEHWVGGGLRHRCDGETCVMWLDEKSGTYRTDPIPCPGGCKETGRLMVIIPELQRFAYVSVETHSIWDIITLEENLQAIESLRGSLQGIPFNLKRRPREISTPGPDGKRVRREKWLLSIEVDPTWAAMQLDAMQRTALTAISAERPALPDFQADDPVEDGDWFEDVEEDTAGSVGTPVKPAFDPAKFWLGWNTPDDAYEWAQREGVYSDEPTARAAMAPIIAKVGGGKISDGNMGAIFEAYVANGLALLETRKTDAIKLMHALGNALDPAAWKKAATKATKAAKVDSTKDLPLATIAELTRANAAALRAKAQAHLSAMADDDAKLMMLGLTGDTSTTVDDIEDGWPLYHFAHALFNAENGE